MSVNQAFHWFQKKQAERQHQVAAEQISKQLHAAYPGHEDEVGLGGGDIPHGVTVVCPGYGE